MEITWFTSPLRAGPTSKLQVPQGRVFQTHIMLNHPNTLHSIKNTNAVSCSH